MLAGLLEYIGYDSLYYMVYLGYIGYVIHLRKLFIGYITYHWNILGILGIFILAGVHLGNSRSRIGHAALFGMM